MLVGYYNIEGITVVVLTFGFAICYELLVVRNAIERQSFSTHVSCLDCEELVLQNVSFCGSCGCKIVSQNNGDNYIFKSRGDIFSNKKINNQNSKEVLDKIAK